MLDFGRMLVVCGTKEIAQVRMRLSLGVLSVILVLRRSGIWPGRSTYCLVLMLYACGVLTVKDGYGDGTLLRAIME